jgi:negative regulator of sigma E activity
VTTPPSEDFDQDPTGMRDLLRSLPDPGPMPPAVADRITAALAREQEARAGDDNSNVTPLARPASSGMTGAPRKSASRRPMQLVGGLVAAAAVAAVAVVGINSLNNDQAPTSAVPSAGASTSLSNAQLAGKVKVASTGTDYTSASFNAQAASMAGDTASGTPDPAIVTQLGSLATPEGIATCARSVGGSLLDDPDDIKVDLARFDGKPALVVVVRKGTTETAFAVSTTCSKGTTPYAAPRTV